jgi:hypothetical protein
MNTSDIMLRYVFTHKANEDSGVDGKAFEVAIRSYIMGRNVKAVKGQGKTDIRFSLDGKRYTCEIKSACGELNGTESAQFVIYCPNVDIWFPAELQGYVFTREQWADFLNGYTGRGKFLRYDSKRGKYHIQSFYVSEEIRPKASKPIAAYIESVLFDMPTVEEFFGRG